VAIKGVGVRPEPARLRVSGAITMRLAAAISPKRIGSNNVVMRKGFAEG
jgi:hypothetical protein